MPPRRGNLRGSVRTHAAAVPSREGLSTRSSIGSATAPNPTSSRASSTNAVERTATGSSASTAPSDSSESATTAAPNPNSAKSADTAATPASSATAQPSTANANAASALAPPTVSASARIAAGAAAIANAAASAAARRDTPASPASTSASASFRGSPFQNAVLGRSGGGTGSELTSMQQRTKETIERILEFKIESMIPQLQARIQRGITPVLMQKVTDSVTERFEQFAQEYARVKSSLTRASATPAPTAPLTTAAAPSARKESTVVPVLPLPVSSEKVVIEPVEPGPSTAPAASAHDVAPMTVTDAAAAADEDNAAVEELTATDKGVESAASAQRAKLSAVAPTHSGAASNAPSLSAQTASTPATATTSLNAPAPASSSILAALPPLPDKNATATAKIEALEKRDVSLVHALKTLDAQLRGVSSQVENLVRWKKLIEQHALRAETAAAASGSQIGAPALNKRPGSLMPVAPSPLQQQAISRHHLMQQQIAQGAIVGRASFPPGPSSSTPFRKRKRKPAVPSLGDESASTSVVGGDVSADISTASNESPSKRQRTEQDGDSVNDSNAANRANQPDRDMQIAFLDLLRAEMGLTDRKWPAFPGYDVSELDWPRFDPTEAQLAAWQALPPTRRPPIGTIGTRKLRLDWDLTPTNPTIQSTLIRLRDQILASPDAFNIPEDPVRRDAEVALNAIKRSYFEVRRHGKQANAAARANGTLTASGQEAAAAAAATAQASGSANPAIASTGIPTSAAIDPPKPRGRPRKDRDSLVAAPSTVSPVPAAATMAAEASTSATTTAAERSTSAAPAVSAPPAKKKRGPKPGFKKLKAAAEAAAAAAAAAAAGEFPSSAAPVAIPAEPSAAAASTGAKVAKDVDKEKSRTVYNIKQRRVARRKARRQQRENEMKKRNGWLGTDIETATSLDAVSEDETDAEEEQAMAEVDEDGKKKKTGNAPARAIVPEWRSKELALVIADLEKTIKRSRSILPPLGLTPIRTALPSTLRRWQVSETFAKAHPDLVKEVQLNMGPFMGSPSNGSPTVAKGATSWGTPLVLNFSGAGAPTIVMNASAGRGGGSGGGGGSAASGSGTKSTGGGNGSRPSRPANSAAESGSGSESGSGGGATGGGSNSTLSAMAASNAAAAAEASTTTAQPESAESGGTGYPAARAGAGSSWPAMSTDGFGSATSTTEMPSRGSSVADSVPTHPGHHQQQHGGYGSTQQQQSADSGVTWYPAATSSGSGMGSAAHAQYSGHSASSRPGGGYLSLTASPQTRGATTSGAGGVDDYGGGGSGSSHLRNSSSIRGTPAASSGGTPQTSSASGATDYSSYRGTTGYLSSGYANGSTNRAAMSTTQNAQAQQQVQQQAQSTGSYWPFGYHTTSQQQQQQPQQQQQQQHNASGSNSSNIRSTFGWGFSSNG